MTMPLFNRLFRGDTSLLNDPFRVLEVSVEDYTVFHPICREECIVLYKGEENENKKFDVVFQTDIHRSTKKAFSIYRTTNESNAQLVFRRMCEKVPCLFDSFPDMGLSKASLQKVSEVIQKHPTWSTAHIAAHFGYIKNSRKGSVVNSHILSQINEVCPDTQETPLHVAIKAQQIASINALVSLDVRMDIVDAAGDSVLHYAAVTTKEIVKALTVRPITAIIDLKNKKGHTALQLACIADKFDCVMELLRNGADVKSVCENDVCEDMPDAEMHDAEQPQRSMKEVIDACINQFSKSDIKHGGTPLHWCMSRELMVMLIEHGCNVDAKNFAGDTALHMMVKHNRLSCAMTLLSYHADVNAQDADGNTPLHIAVKCVNISLVQLLVVFGSNVNLANNRGETARHILATLKKSGYGEVLYALHTVGAERCTKGRYSCNEGCSYNGHFNGIPPQHSPRSNPSELFDELLEDITIASGVKKHRMDECLSKQRSGAKRCRVLSLDGGGIRGLVLIQLLYELEKVVGIPIIRCFDWVAGTSTGGILALVLASGKSVNEARCIYFQMKDKVFVGIRPYPAEALETILKKELGSDTKMADITTSKIMITATKADRKPAELHIFRNYSSPINILGHEEIDTLQNNTPIPKPEEQLIWQAARSTGAAPTYFRASGQFIDGGLISNNPALDVLTEIHQCNQAHIAMGHEDEVVDITCLVSLGTGKPPLVPIDTIDVFRPDSFLGVYKIALGVTAVGELLVDQATQTDGRVVARTQSMCRMLNIPYYRLNPQMSECVSLDETDDRALAKLLWETTAYMHSIRDQLEVLAILLRP